MTQSILQLCEHSAEQRPMAALGTRGILRMILEEIKRLKKRLGIVNPIPSLKEMQRFVCKEPQQYPCLGGYKYFYLDWNLDLWRCHHWKTPMCPVHDFDGFQRVRNRCTLCMIDCYRYSSVMHHIGQSIHDAYQLLKSAKFGKTTKILLKRSNFGSIRAVFEELAWILRI